MRVMKTRRCLIICCCSLFLPCRGVHSTFSCLGPSLCLLPMSKARTTAPASAEDLLLNTLSVRLVMSCLIIMFKWLRDTSHRWLSHPKGKKESGAFSFKNQGFVFLLNANTGLCHSPGSEAPWWVTSSDVHCPKNSSILLEHTEPKRNAPFLQKQAPSSPLQYIHSLIHPEPQVSKQIQPLPLAVSISSTPLYIFLCYSQDRMLFPSSSGAAFPWLPSPPLPSHAAPIPIPCKEPRRRRAPAKQFHNFFLSLRIRNFCC